MPEESLLVICPNPKCRREIEEPILLTILSVTPPKKYEACPYCFSKLEQEDFIEQDIFPEPTIEQDEMLELEEEPETEDELHANNVLEKVKETAPRLLERVKALIPNSNGSKKEKEEETEKPIAEPAFKKEELPKEEDEEEPVAKEEELEEAFEDELSDTEETVKEEARAEESAKKESGQPGCPEEFGYLANRPKDAPIPSGCLTCPKMVDCMLSPRDDY